MALKDWSETASDNDDADATINWLEGQAPSTVNGSARAMMAVLRKNRTWVSAKDVGAVGDNSTDDSDALDSAASYCDSQKRVLYIPGAQYKVTRALDWTNYPNLTVVGDGYAATPSTAIGTEIIQHTDNTPILKIAKRPLLFNFSLRYNTQQTSAQTSSTAVELYNISGGGLRNFRVYRAHISYGLPQVSFSDTTGNFLFNMDLSSLESWEASHTHYDFRNFNGGGTNCRLGPLYINGGGSLDFSTSAVDCSYGIRGFNWSGWDLSAVSMDGLIITEQLLETTNCKFTVGSIRTEAMTFRNDNDGWIKLGGSDSHARIGYFEAKTCRALLADVPNASYLFRVNATRSYTDIGSVFVDDDCTFTTGVARALTFSASDTGSEFYLRHFNNEASGLSNTAWTDSSGFAHTAIKFWNGAVVATSTKSGNGTTINSVDYGTAAPVSGTWTAGSIRWNVAPVAGGTVGWVCTTAGTPGTWKTFGTIAS